MDQARSPQKITDPKVALGKAEHYCAYQERAQQEVRDKLYEWGLWPDAVEQTIATLVETNFLNEERFARNYAKSKFSQKSWGRIKIKQGLKFKKVPEKLIQKALKEIDGDDYVKVLGRIIEKKGLVLAEKDARKRPIQIAPVCFKPGVRERPNFGRIKRRVLVISVLSGLFKTVIKR